MPRSPASESSRADAERALLERLAMGAVSGDRLAVELGLTRAAVWKRIDALKRPIELEVDGGINAETAKAAIAAGADVLVAGTATFTGGAAQYAGNIARLRAA